ncbi:MAG: lycopene beta-cyclase CrtY [Acidobacteria bacterium]|nr:lycopene beta-cyclase CrtY [Acidobacteriota bacterium]
MDLCIVGGGLAGSLAAWRYRQARPGRRVCLIEAGDTLGGNHTWSFHASDLSPAARQWLAPLIAARWPRHRVRFAAYARTLEAEYCTVTAAQLHTVISGALGTDVLVGTGATDVSPTSVRLSDGRTVQAHVVIDARGATDGPTKMGWQVFLGLELECARPHGVDAPMLMDATVPQLGGFRFMYVLPFSSTRLLVEDTCYADDPRIDIAAAESTIAAYTRAQGWAVAHEVRRERGALPIPLGGRIDDFWTSAVPRLGVRGGFFHPTTGFSLPDAVATAEAIAAIDLLTTDRVYAELRRMATERWRARAFFRLLNRWLFRAARPDARADLLAHFYSRPESTIARFYAGQLSWSDCVRLLAGRPPIPISSALRHLRE